MWEIKYASAVPKNLSGFLAMQWRRFPHWASVVRGLSLETELDNSFSNNVSLFHLEKKNNFFRQCWPYIIPYLLTILLLIPLNKLPWLKSLLHSLQKGPRHGHQKSQHQKFQIMRLKATKKKVPTITVDPVKKGFCFGRILIKVSEFVGKY